MSSATSLPSGLVTFVITDIEGSTRLLRTWGSGYVEALERHRALLRAVWAEFRGAEVNTEGDSFIVAFDDPTNAVRACGNALSVIDAEPWRHEPLRIRIGAHRGPAQARGGDYVALALHQTARVASAANGGQAIVTDEVLDAVETSSSLRTALVGRFRLRDFTDPVDLHRIDPADIEPNETPLRARPAERHNLPEPTAPMIDRSDELVELATLVQPGTVTTVCGPGGVGKTSLVSEFGRRHADDWDDGIWMCSFASLRSGGDLPGAIADELRIPITGPDDPTDQLLTALAERRCVLALDNCERLSTDVAALVRAVRSSCPSVAVLTTSRAPLGLIGEQQCRLGPFPSVPGPASLIGPAVELFVLRAADPGAVTSDDFDAVRALCDRLDGLPLAIELAAARNDVLQPSEMLRHFERRQGSFVAHDPSVPPRQRSMDATIDWSYDLLDDLDSTVLRRLTVLRSSFDLDTAVAVCADETLDADLVPERVWSLVSKSVVDRPPPDGATRYRLFSTVRSRVAQHAHPAELVAAAGRAAAHLDSIVGPDRLTSPAWASRIDAELDNIRGVIDADTDVDGGIKLRLLWSIGMLHDVRDEFALGIEEVSRRIADAPPTAELVGVLTLLGDLHLRVGRLDDAAEAAHRAETLAAQVGAAPWDLGGIDRTKGELALRRADLDAAERIARDALDAGAVGQPAARLWNLLGLVHANQGDFGDAASAFERELDIWRRLGNDAATTVVHGNLAEALLRNGATSAAARHQLECLRGATDLGRPLLVAFSVTVAAHLAAESSKWTLALELQGASDALLEHAAYVLYDADDRSRTDLLDRARVAVGDAEVSTALARGRTMLVVDAAERAGDVLERAATRV